jgi:hypothetical protein
MSFINMTVFIKNKRVCIGDGRELKPQPINKRPDMIWNIVDQ